jgi:hypothetical protein
MTLLAPDIPILPRLERLGAELLVADNRSADVLVAVSAKAAAELDGMYGVTRETAGLIRALQAACAIEALHSAGTPIGCDLRTAVWHLRRAAKAVQIAMSKRQSATDLAEAHRRLDAEFAASLKAMLAERAEAA